MTLPRVLLVCAHEARCAMFHRYLHEAGIAAVIDECGTPSGPASDYDCVVVDDDRAAVVRLRGAATPILFIGDGDEAGATDWLPATGLSAELLARRLMILLRLARAEQQVRHAEDEVAAQRRLLRAVLEQLPAGVALLSPTQEEVVLTSGAFDVLESPIADAARAALRAAIEKGLEVDVAEPVYHDGRRYRVRAKPVVDAAAILGGLLVVEDVSDIVAARDAAQHAARALEDLLAVVSHDLRGPLSAINVALDALGDATIVGDARARYIASMKRSIQKADRLLDDLLTVHRIDVGTFQVTRTPVALHALLAQVVHDHELVAERAGMRLVWTVEEGVDAIRADRFRVAQALDNLIGNALKYASGSSQLELSASADGDRVAVRVRDHGPGIPVDELPHVFDRDWQGRSRRGGAGLGLAIVRGIARAHGGDITAANAADGGAVFTLSLPT